MESSVLIKDILHPCSICKNRNSEYCEYKCVSKREQQIMGSRFVADTTKIGAHFVDEYYDLLYKYKSLLEQHTGLECHIDTYHLED